MIPFKNFMRIYCHRAKENLTVLLVFLTFLAALAYLEVGNIPFSANIPVSLADGFVSAGSGYQFYCSSALLPLWIFFLLIRQDFSLQRLIRNRDVLHIWNRQMLLALINTLFFMGFRMLLIFAFVSPKSITAINFDNNRSCFAYATNGKTISGMEFWQLLLGVAVFLILANFFLQAFFLLLIWIFNNPLWPFLIMLFLAFLDITGIFGICTVSGVYYTQWLDYQPQRLLIPVVLISAVYSVGGVYTRRKDFSHAQ